MELLLGKLVIRLGNKALLLDMDMGLPQHTELDKGFDTDKPRMNFEHQLTTLLRYPKLLTFFS
jgi:hypothetical protein